MSITVYTREQEKEWHEFIARFPKADVYYTPEYTHAFETIGDGEAQCICYEDGDFCAVNVVMKRPVPNPNGSDELTGYYDFVTPYGYGGFLVSNPDDADKMRRLQDCYEQYCVENHIVAEFVRFHPVLNNAHTVENMYQVIDLGHTVCLDLTDPEVIWQNITSKNRNMIRKAEKNDVTIHMGASEELYCTFEEIYNETMRKVEATDYYFFPKRFYDSVREKLSENSTLFYAMKDDKIVAMSIILFTEGAMHYHLSASRREYQTYAPTNLLLYKAAVWGYEHGMKTFHLGGGLGSHEDHLYHFKKEFNRGEDTQFSIGKKTYLPKIYDRLCDEVHADSETSFFPRYRA